MKELKIWPHLTIVAVVCAALAGGGVALWMRQRQNTAAQTLLSAARIERVDGDVALENGLNQRTADKAANWVQATSNQPFTVGDRIYTRENSHASLAFTGRNFARLYPNTSLDILSLNQRQTQLALREGSAAFDLGYLAPGELFEVATPYGAVDLNQPGFYNVGIDNGNVIVSVLSGLAQVVGLGGSGQISKGEMLTLLGQTAADVVLSRLNGRDAGYLIDDYYSYQYPNYYDGRYRDYNVYLDDPYYFDPYRRYASYQYVSGYLPGLNDLDYYGDWQNVNGYGYCWRPRVDSGWAPYEQGYWMEDYPYGPTWVSAEPWGYTPYHYGRWAFLGNQWYWIPDRTSTPLYSPALVAFVPIDQGDIGWVPLGPSDAYAPRYYDDNWQPYYLTRTDIVQRNLANLYVPGAVTVLPVDDFTSGDWRRGRKADRQMLAQVQPVLDPLTLTPLRNAVLHSAWGRGKKSIPPGIARKLDTTTVVTSTQPVAPPFRRDFASSFHVRPAPERAREQKFKVRDQRAIVNSGAGSQEVRASAGENTGRSFKQRERQQQVENMRGQRNVQTPTARGERVALPQRQQPQREVRQPEVRRGQGQVRINPPAQAVERRAPVRVEQPRAARPRIEQPRVLPPQRPAQARVPQPRVEQPRAQPHAQPMQPQRQEEPHGNGRVAPSAAPARQPQAQPGAQQQPGRPSGPPPKQDSGGQPGKGKGRKP